MEDNRENLEKQEEQIPKFRGLYRHVNISVRSLDYIIVACGGTDVTAVNQMYGELLEEPEPPTREGYVFSGWYTDSSCYERWDVSNDIIQSDMILYAGWQKLQ